MSDGYYSANWYRVARLKPKLHPHVRIHRHQYRGIPWYLIEDTTTGRSHRFNRESYQFIGLLDGTRPVAAIYAAISEQLGEFVPGQQDIIDVLVQLDEADLITSDSAGNTEELFAWQSSRKQKKLQQQLGNPVAIKLPLWDPDKFLTRHFNKVKWLFSGWVALGWLLVMLYAIFQAAVNWTEIGQHFEVNALSPNNVFLMIVLYPLIKIVHELGHGFSAKLEGGEVHEMGVNFMLFMPIPYVNVTTSTFFRSKYKRILVSAAGILIESFLAAVGLLLFLAAEPGLVRDIGFNMFLIGGVSSLFFNGNPLLKFDAYYILADAVDIPNLYQRSGQYWSYMIKRYIFRLPISKSPAYIGSEIPWFLSYGLLSQLYRLSILWFIISMVSDLSLLAGVILGGWLITLQILLPLGKGLHGLLSSHTAHHFRKRNAIIMSVIGGALVVLLGFIPVPSYTTTEGIVWQPDDAKLVASGDGFAGETLVDNNSIITTGTPILRLEDPLIDSKQRILRARLKELNIRHRAQRVDDQVQAEIIRDQIRVTQSELDYLTEKRNKMEVRADKDGRLLLSSEQDLHGQLIRKGDLIGYIIDDNELPIIRMAVHQDHIGQLREQIADIEVRFISHLKDAYPADIIRQSPEAVNRLPSPALTVNGGGQFIPDATASNPLTIKEKVFLIDLQLTGDDVEVPLGTRAYIRVNHGGESIAIQLYRRIRQTFLRQLSVDATPLPSALNGGAGHAV